MNDGGPAFPNLPPLGPDGLAASGYPYVSDGMSLRDYFAAKALQGMLADHTIEMTMGEYADWAYEMADAMLAMREAK